MRELFIAVTVAVACTAASAQFAEKDVAIVHTFTATQDGDGFGTLARAVRDVDGDRREDIVVTAPRFKVEDAVCGAVFVYSGKSGALLWKATGEAGSGFGAAAAGSRDLDGVKGGEILVGAPAEGKTGCVHVLSGATGKVVHTLAGEQDGDRFGASVFGPGDFDRDRSNDVVVGAPGHDDGAGRVYLYSWKDPKKAKRTIDGAPGAHLGLSVGAMPRTHRPLFAAAGARTAIYYRGMKLKPQKPLEFAKGDRVAITIAGDVDKDGFPDLIVIGTSTRIVSSDEGKQLFTFEGYTAGRGRAGDVDRDAWEDWVLGAPEHGGGAGRVTVFSGKTGEPLYDLTGTAAGGRLGSDTDGIRDVSGDRHADLIVTRPGCERGAVYVVSGKPREKRKDSKPEDG